MNHRHGQGVFKRISINYNKEIDVRIAGLIFVIVFTSVFGIANFARGMYNELKYKSYYDYRIAELKDMLVDQPGNGGNAVELAMVMYLDGQERKAIDLARKVYKDLPEDKMVMLYLGLMLSDNGQAEEAVQVLTKLSGSYPRYQRDKTLFYTGKSFYEMGQFDKAMENFNACVEFNPGMSNALLYIGKCKERLGDKPGALEVYRRVLKTNPNQLEAVNAVKRLEGR